MEFNISSGLLKRLCSHITGITGERMLDHYQLAVSLLNDSILTEPISDCSVIGDKIKRWLVHENRYESATRFDILLNKLQRSKILRNKGAILYLFMCLRQQNSPTCSTSGSETSSLFPVPLITPETSDDDEFDKCRNNKHISSSDLTYGDIGLYSFGPPGKRLVDITIVISQVGFCCGYLIYLCENLKKHLNGLDQGQWLVLLLPPIYGLTLLRHLNKLAIFSLFAQVSNVFALTVVFWFDFSHSEEVPFHAKEVSLRGFPFFFAVAIYCYEGAGMILSLEESVAQQKKKMFKPIFVSTMIALTLLYITFGASGYLSFGPHTQQIITLNLPHGDSSVDFAAIVKICLGVSFFFTYPMMLFPVTHLIDKTFGLQNDKMKGNLVRLVLVLLTGIVVIAIPSFAILASLIGATCCTLLAFIMPAAFHLAIFKNRLTKRQYYFDVALIVLGIMGTVIGLWDTLHRISEQPHRVNELAQDHPKGNGMLLATTMNFSGTEASFTNVTSKVNGPPGPTQRKNPFPNQLHLVSQHSKIADIQNHTTLSFNSTNSSSSLVESVRLSSNSSDFIPPDSKSVKIENNESKLSGQGQPPNDTLTRLKRTPLPPPPPAQPSNPLHISSNES